MENKSVILHFLECDSEKDQCNLKVLDLNVNRELLSLTIINNFMKENVGKKYRLYNSNGLEIVDYSDIERYSLEGERNRVVFYTKHDDVFETKNILRVYKTIKKLGEGGFGLVYLAEHIYSKQLVAIKYLKSSFSRNDYSFLYKEIEALKILTHKNIIRLFNYCMLEDSKLVFILEYVSGGSLRDYLDQKKSFTEQEVLKIFRQLIETIYYCHSKGIIHRDLKLENILFTDETKTAIKLIDFGLAGLVKNDQSKAGSIRYMSPEVISGENREAIPSVDIWSLGCILYELLTGKYLFDGSSRIEIKEKILQCKYTIPTYEYSYEVTNMLELMLKPNVKERSTTIMLMKHPWIRGEIVPQNVNTSDQANPARKRSNSFDLQQKIIKRKEKRRITTFETTLPLPTLVTKVRLSVNPNIAVIQELNNNVPGYLKPIGHDKTQKRNLTKLRSYLEKVNETVERKTKEKSVGALKLVGATHIILKKPSELKKLEEKKCDAPMLKSRINKKSTTIKPTFGTRILVSSREKDI